MDNPNGKWVNLEYPDGHTVPMDAAIVLRGKRYSTGTNNSGGAVTVTVTDSLANPVPGTTRVEPTDDGWPITSHLVWRPVDPLQPGSTYTVEWRAKSWASVSGDIDGSATITTSAEIGALPKLTVSTAELLRISTTTGKMVACTGDSDCSLPFFGTDPIEAYGIHFFVDPPLGSNPYQALSIREVSGKGALIDVFEQDLNRRVHVLAAPWYGRAEFWLWFANEVPEYCVQVIQRDLRNDAEVGTDVCATRTDLAPSGGTSQPSLLAQCDAPPDVLLDAWCAVNPHATTTCQKPPGGGQSPADSSGCACKAAVGEGLENAFPLVLAAGLLYAARRRRLRRTPSSTREA